MSERFKQLERAAGLEELMKCATLPTTTLEERVKLTFYLSTEEAKQLNLVARGRGESRTEVVRRAVRRELERSENENIVKVLETIERERGTL